jgi:WD40 repeat protein
MSMDFMSVEVRRMTLQATAAKAAADLQMTTLSSLNNDENSLKRMENDVQVRRTLVHRAISKLRNEARSKHRDWRQTFLNDRKQANDSDAAVAGVINGNSNNASSNDATTASSTTTTTATTTNNNYTFNDDDGHASPTDLLKANEAKDIFSVAKKAMAVTHAYNKLKKGSAKASWFSEYQEQYNYEHRVQKDGFQFIFEYKAHYGNHVKSFFPTIPIDMKKGTDGHQIAFVSLDKSGFNFWESSSSGSDMNTSITWTPPLTHKRVAFKRRQNEFIQALCYIPKHGMFVGAGLDMLAHIYDKNLNHITVLPTNERVIKHIVYNVALDQIIIAGSGGCKAWKLDRSYSNGTYLFNLIVIRNYITEKAGESNWVTHIEFDEDTQRLILIANDKVSCINTRNGELISLLSNIHEAPLTGCVWYNRSQYFITSCAAGLVKVWAIHHDGNMQYGKHDYALLHVFTGHTKSVTALQLHPLSGLAVSVSLDGTLRVLNLEALEEIYVLTIMQPLVAMKCVRVVTGAKSLSLCIGATVDGTIRVWSINDFLGFYGVCRAKCEKAVIIYPPEADTGKPDSSGDVNAVVVAGEDIRVFDSKGMLLSNMIPGQLYGSIKCTTYSMPHKLLFILHGSAVRQRISVFDCRVTPCTYLCVFGDPAGMVENDLTTDMILINVKRGTFDDHLLSKTRAKTTERTSALFKDHAMHAGERDPSNVGFRFDEGMIADQVLVFGTKTGSIFFVQPGPKPKVISTYKDSHYGPVLQLKYSHALKRLVSLGVDSDADKYELKVWTVPEMRHCFTIPMRAMPTAATISDTLPYIALGYADGLVQLIEIVGNAPVEVDNVHTLEQHIDVVTNITFCDQFHVYCSASNDHSIKVWDFGNRLLDRVMLNKDPSVCFFNGKAADVVVGQGNYLLKIMKSTWLPAGAQEVLENSQQKDAVIKIQSKLRGASIRRVLGSGIRTKQMSFIGGDDTGGGGHVLGADGKFHRGKKHGRYVSRQKSSFDQNWAQKLQNSASAANGKRQQFSVAPTGMNIAEKAATEKEGGGNVEEDDDRSLSDFGGSDDDDVSDDDDDIDGETSSRQQQQQPQPQRPKGPKKRTAGGFRSRSAVAAVFGSEPVDKECALSLGKISNKTIEGRLAEMRPPIGGAAKRYALSCATPIGSGSEFFVGDREGLYPQSPDGPWGGADDDDDELAGEGADGGWNGYLFASEGREEDLELAIDEDADSVTMREEKERRDRLGDDGWEVDADAVRVLSSTTESPAPL